MTGVIEEDINIVPFKKVKKRDQLEKSAVSFTLNRQRNKSGEMSLPAEKKDLPVDEWIMPAQPQGYIKGRDHDLL